MSYRPYRPRPATQLKSMWERAIEFIAYNDEPNELRLREIEGFISVITVAETFSCSTTMVARAVRKLRRKAEGEDR